QMNWTKVACVNDDSLYGMDFGRAIVDVSMELNDFEVEDFLFKRNNLTSAEEAVALAVGATLVMPSSKCPCATVGTSSLLGEVAVLGRAGGQGAHGGRWRSAARGAEKEEEGPPPLQECLLPAPVE
ncbi:hypothetical protein CYMTET_30063, partial [Cymbomonas tetramitiformis]